jgi:hypothetical protein
MKRTSTLSTLLDTSTPWLAWWQELILNWAASWQSIETLHITSSKTDDGMSWHLPTDLELARLNLEELLSAELGQREG